MSSAITNMKETIERYRNGAKRLRESAKSATNEIVCTGLAAATAGAIGAYDEAKGTTQQNDEGITTAMVGPLPAALVVAGLGKVGSFVMLGDETGKLASAVGQGGLDAFSYVMGRRLWKRHEANTSK